MNAEIERLFESALEVPPARRAEFLSAHCADAALRREVELLLEHDCGAEALLEQAVGGAAASVVESLALERGQRVGSYRILSILGRGGMGVVYLAERADGNFEQRVAIKVVRPGWRKPWRLGCSRSAASWPLSNTPTSRACWMPAPLLTGGRTW